MHNVQYSKIQYFAFDFEIQYHKIFEALHLKKMYFKYQEGTYRILQYFIFNHSFLK